MNVGPCRGRIGKHHLNVVSAVRPPESEAAGVEQLIGPERDVGYQVHLSAFEIETNREAVQKARTEQPIVDTAETGTDERNDRLLDPERSDGDGRGPCGNELNGPRP